jgi:hypothetical protein
MTVEVTQGPQGLLVSANGSPARPLSWVEDWTFRQGNAFLTFRRTGNSGPAVDLDPVGPGRPGQNPLFDPLDFFLR